ncbi:MAG: CotH kinase family protein [Polyangiaceae bacterium]
MRFNWLCTSRVLAAIAAIAAGLGCGDSGSGGAGGGGGPSSGGSHAGGGGASQGGGGADPTCSDQPPAAPVLVSPSSGAVGVVPDALSIELGAFSDPDGGDYAGAEIEIWSDTQGAPKARVWHIALGASDSAVGVLLAAGTWDDPQVAALDPWEDYLIRARWISSQDGCTAPGAYSEFSVFKTDDGSAYLFDESQIRDYYLEIPQESMDAMNAEAYPPGCVPFTRSYHTAKLTFEGQTFDGIGVKIKGGCGSARDLYHKTAFKINLSWDDPAVPGCPADRRLFGLKHLTLNNGVEDRSATHERLAYRLFRELGVPAPRIAHARVFVNGELYGLYQNVETVDRRFLDRWFGSKEGMLYEGTYYCDLVPGNLPPTETDDGCLTREFTPSACSTPDPAGDPLTYGPVTEFVNQIQAIPDGQFYAQAPAFLNLDEFLDAWAVAALTGYWDGYWYDLNNNYRVYHDPSTGLWSVISTGLDQTFESVNMDPFAVTGILGQKCIADSACFAALVERVKAVRDVYVADDLGAAASAIAAQIDPYVQADPRREYSYQTYLDFQSYLQDFIASRPDIVDQYIQSYGF